MKKLWKIFGITILVVFILGLICVGVGILTGADSARIYAVIDEKFRIESTMALYGSYFEQLRELVSGLFS